MHRPHPRADGFTLIELMIVVAIVSLIAAIAVPNLLSARIASNESSAIATLKSIASAQAQCTNRKFIDIDGDGCGEFGLFTELAGATPPRGLAGREMLPPLLAGSFRTVTAGGFLSHSGYNFIMYLPDVGGAGLEETAANYGAIDPNGSENFFCCYAWPRENTTTGRRAFFVNQLNEILWTDNVVQGYHNSAVVPASDAAFPAVSAGHIDQRYVVGQVANDGGAWVVLN
jgi:prepilin-type N-terminal cleavage/methylation domain-containing protein